MALCGRILKRNWLLFMKIFILEIFSENCWLGLRSKLSNNEKKNLEYKLNFVSFFNPFEDNIPLIFSTSSVISLESKMDERTWLKNLSSALVEKNGITYRKQNLWQYFSSLLFASVLSWIFHNISIQQSMEY